MFSRGVTDLSYWDKWLVLADITTGVGIRMFAQIECTLSPRSGHMLVVGIVAQISVTPTRRN